MLRSVDAAEPCQFFLGWLRVTSTRSFPTPQPYLDLVEWSRRIVWSDCTHPSICELYILKNAIYELFRLYYRHLQRGEQVLPLDLWRYGLWPSVFSCSS